MKSAKPTPVDAPSHRRSQPSRQARTNPSRRPANASRAGDGSNAASGGRPLGAQPVDILPAITHFADSMSALPKELVRHFTLLKEVDAKIFAPEEQLFKLVAATRESRLPEPRTADDASHTTALSGSAALSVQNSYSGMMSNQAPSSSATAAAAAAASVSSSAAAPISVFDPSNLPRRQLFRQTAFKIKEMLVSLEEKNHVLSTANEALQRQLARVEDVWPYLENEFSEEAKWGSTTHWAYPENRASGKVSQAEKMRRDGAAAISAAAQALAEEAAARSDARKQAVQARKSLKNQHQDSDVDDGEKRQKEVPKKTNKSRKSGVAAAATAAAGATDTNHVSVGVSGSTSNGSHAPKRRRVEKTANGEKAGTAAAANNLANAATTTTTTTTTTTNTGAGAADAATTATPTTAAPTSTSTPTSTPASAPAPAPTPASIVADASSSSSANTTGSATAGTAAGSLSLAAGNDAFKPKTSSPRGTPAPDGHRKRKALPTGSGQSKKKNGVSPSATTSPVMDAIPDPKAGARPSPAPSNAPRSAPSRDRRNSIQSNADNSRTRPPSSAPVNKTNGHGIEALTSEQASSAPFPKPGNDGKPAKEAGTSVKTTELIKRETENPEGAPSPTMTTTIANTTMATPSTISKMDSKPEEADSKSESAARPVPPSATKKSGRASKPSTPALATFQEAAASRSRPSRTVEGNNSSGGGNNHNHNNNGSGSGSGSSNNNSNSSSNSHNNNMNMNNSRKSHKKAGSVAQQAVIQQMQAADTDASSSMQEDDDEGDIDADEPTYCYCNSVSYGEMVACDADGCEREWFHLACVGLKVAPGSKTKWYCEDCKDRLKMSSKKAGR
ncbi:hypothetical protein E4U43_003734 [Claviceps pusilla]|uniref:Chromatin modification-related protein n=1 Tax=Claviceps pusilla TaxID=123648 RepID=A0A9P7NHS4_9HYPO|nr:hypothetical protein E4U43_003734 [Claviceps pusilla]